MSGSETGNEVDLECLDGTFRFVGAVNMGRCVLDGYIVLEKGEVARDGSSLSKMWTVGKNPRSIKRVEMMFRMRCHSAVVLDFIGVVRMALQSSMKVIAMYLNPSLDVVGN